MTKIKLNKNNILTGSGGLSDLVGKRGFVMKKIKDNYSVEAFLNDLMTTWMEDGCTFEEAIVLIQLFVTSNRFIKSYALWYVHQLNINNVSDWRHYRDMRSVANICNMTIRELIRGYHRVVSTTYFHGSGHNFRTFKKDIQHNFNSAIIERGYSISPSFDVAFRYGRNGGDFITGDFYVYLLKITGSFIDISKHFEYTYSAYEVEPLRRMSEWLGFDGIVIREDYEWVINYSPKIFKKIKFNAYNLN